MSLQRLGGRDGRVLGSEALPVPSSGPRLFADAVAAALRHGYGDRRLRVARLELEIQDEDYRAFLDLKQRAHREGASETSWPAWTSSARRPRRSSKPTPWRQGRPPSVPGQRASPATSSAGLAGRERGPRGAPASGGSPAPLDALFDLDLAAGHLDEAEAALAQLAEIDPAGSLLQRGQLAERRGRPAEGLELMRAAVRLQPSWPIPAHPGQRRVSPGPPRRRAAAPGAAPARVARQPRRAQDPGPDRAAAQSERAVALLREAAKSDPGSDP